jgi:hypothetical protein
MFASLTGDTHCPFLAKLLDTFLTSLSLKEIAIVQDPIIARGEKTTLIKEKIKFSSYIRKFRMEQLQSHMTNGLLLYGDISSYIRKPFLIYDFATFPLCIFLYMSKI